MIMMSIAVMVVQIIAAAAGGAGADELQAPALDRLPTGAIQPKGWLKDQALLQGNGMTGALGFWGGGISHSLWIPPKPECAKEGCGRKPSGEQGSGYYLNGMIPLTCQVDLPQLRELRDASVQHVLNISKDGDGILGPALTNATKVNTYWGRMSVVLALQSFCECEGVFAPGVALKQEMEAALVKHHISMARHVAAHSPELTHDVWGSARYVEVLLGAQWLIDRGHTDPELWQLMRDVRAQSEAVLGWEQWFIDGDPQATMTRFTARCWGNKSDPTEHNWQKHHGVSIMEAIKTGAAWYRVSGNVSDANNSAAAVAWIDKWSRNADGTFSAPDCITEIPHTPTAGVETCSVVEEMFSLRTAYEITGDIALFDRLEWVAFNSMPSTTDAHWTGNSHYHSVNQADARKATLAYSPFNGCCTGNVHQGWPKFIMSGVQTKRDTASTSIVVSGYSPHEATLRDGTRVTVSGQYPFADNASITIDSLDAKQSAPALKVALRIPCWVESAEVTVTTSDADVTTSLPATPCSLFQIPQSVMVLTQATRSLHATITFVHEIKVTTNDELGALKWKSPVHAVEITRGPLLFTFPIPSITNITQLNATTDPVWSKKFAGMPTAMVQVTESIIDNSKPWQIALQSPNSTGALEWSGFHPLTAVPFDHTKPPCALKVQAKVVHDKNPKGYPHGHVPSGPIPASMTNGSLFEVELVPIAHSNGLRITVLPVLASSTADQ